MVDEATILAAADLLRAAAPGSGVILFGSYARGDAREGSDLDFLVIEPQLGSKHAEMVRLQRILRPLGVSADVLVTSRSTFEEWRDTPNNVLYDAAREGRVLHEVG